MLRHAFQLTLASCLCLGQQPAPTSDASRPAAAGRVVKLFDFEERGTNPRPVPQFWTRAQDQDDRPRPGFPRFNISELEDLPDEPQATHGCVRLNTRGGSTSLLLDGGVIPVFRDADYLVGARIRTDRLRLAKAVLAARFLDENLRPIPASQRYSQPKISEGQWTPVSIELPGEYPQAAFVQLELLLLQPDQLNALGPIASDGRPEAAPLATDEQGRANSIELRRQDLAGNAYFDDVSIVQLPRLELSTQSAANVVAAPDKPSIHLLVRDLTGEALSGKLIILDASGRTVDTKSLSVGEGRSRSVWSPNLPGFGWYRAVLDMSNSAARVGATFVDFAWVPAPRAAGAERAFGSATDESRFWLMTRDAPTAIYPVLADTCRNLRSGGLSLPIWTRDLTPALVPERTGALRGLVDSFRSERLDLAFSLPVVPDVLTDPKSVAPPDAWTVLTTKWGAAKPLLEEFLDDYGQAVQRWQIGWFQAKGLASRTSLKSGLDTIDSELGKLVPGPIVIAPATLEDPLNVSFGGSNAPSFEPALYLPPDTQSATINAAVESWRSGAAGKSGRLLLALGAATDGELDAADAAEVLAKRAVRAWAAATRAVNDDKSRARERVRLGLVDPWSVRGERHPQLMPRPELAAWRAIVDRLADRQLVCELPLRGGGEAFVFSASKSGSPASGGLLVAWNDASSPDQSVLNHYLGFGPISGRDVFGNTLEVADPSKAPLPLSSHPVFIEGVDAELLHFMSKLDIDPPLLSMTTPETQHNVRITNTWSGPINGRLVLLEPGGRTKSLRLDRRWRINPRLFPFSLAPGESASFPMTVAFGTAEEVGTKPFVFSVELAAGKSYEPFLATAYMELGLRDVSFSVTATPRGDDLVLEATINNQSRDPLAMVMTAFPPEMPRQVVDVGELQPGNQAIHRFVIKGVYPSRKGQQFPVAISDPEAGIRISRTITIP